MLKGFFLHLVKNKFSIRYLSAIAIHWLFLVSLLNTVMDVSVINEPSYNEIESVVEWVAEDWMDLENAIPEDGDEHNEERQVIKKACDWVSCSDTLCIAHTFFDDLENTSGTTVPFYFNPLFDINTPPPEMRA